jgi:hypothetical protein
MSKRKYQQELVIAKYDYVMPMYYRANYVMSIYMELKAHDGEFAIKDLTTPCDEIFPSNQDVSKEDVLTSLSGCARNKWMYVGLSTCGNKKSLTIAFDERYKERFAEIKQKVCSRANDCDYDYDCTSLCSYAEKLLNKFKTSEDELRAMPEKDFREVMQTIKEYYTDDKYEEGPYGGAFKSNDDYWYYREGRHYY